MLDTAAVTAEVNAADPLVGRTAKNAMPNSTWLSGNQ